MYDPHLDGRFAGHLTQRLAREEVVVSATPVVGELLAFFEAVVVSPHFRTLSILTFCQSAGHSLFLSAPLHGSCVFTNHTVLEEAGTWR